LASPNFIARIKSVHFHLTVMSFLFEKLKVYQRSLEFAQEISLFMQKPASGNGALADQLRRAATSIPINLAEGSGRWHANDKKQFFWIARGSANECVPLLRLAVNQNMISPIDYARFCSSLDLIGKMITRLIASVKSAPK